MCFPCVFFYFATIVAYAALRVNDASNTNCPQEANCITVGLIVVVSCNWDTSTHQSKAVICK